MKDTNLNYKSARIRVDTYKKLKLLAIELGIPLTQVIEVLYADYMMKRESKPKVDAD